MLKISKKQKGFTIVELLIVIVVIGILAALVLNSFQGVQARARDTERRTDIVALASQLEVYYSDNTGYPPIGSSTVDGVARDSWVTATLKGVDLNALRTPGASANSITDTATPTKDQYGYKTLNADGSACSAATCAKFVLYYLEEQGSLLKSKNSLN